MKLKNSQILELVLAFTEIGKRNIKSNKKFSYAVVLNDEETQKHKTAIQHVSEPSDAYKKYEAQRMDIIKNYSELDGEGNIKTADGGLVVFKPDVLDDVKTDIDALNDECSDIITDRDQEIVEYNEILDTEVELDITTVSIEDIPDGVGEDISLVKALRVMIK